VIDTRVTKTVDTDTMTQATETTIKGTKDTRRGITVRAIGIGSTIGLGGAIVLMIDLVIVIATEIAIANGTEIGIAIVRSQEIEIVNTTIEIEIDHVLATKSTGPRGSIVDRITTGDLQMSIVDLIATILRKIVKTTSTHVKPAVATTNHLKGTMEEMEVASERDRGVMILKGFIGIEVVITERTAVATEEVLECWVRWQKAENTHLKGAMIAAVAADAIQGIASNGGTLRVHRNDD